MSVRATSPHHYLGVYCSNCGAAIPVPDRVLSRQIAISDVQVDPGRHYISTLLNIRCRACRKEYFYNVREIVDVDDPPRSLCQESSGAQEKVDRHEERFQAAHH
jgi:hypothetical protein